MTIGKAVSKFKSEHRCSLSDEKLIEWLSLLDSVVYNKIILTHERDDGFSFSGYSANTPVTVSLLIPDPFSEIYMYYLAMKKDLLFSDNLKYNNDSVLFRSAFEDYENHYNSLNRPVKKTAFFNA